MIANIDLDNIKKIKWYRQGGAGRAYYFYPPFEALMELIGKENVIIEQENDLHHAFFNSEKEYESAMIDIERQKTDIHFIDRTIAEWSVLNKKLDDYIKDIDFDKISEFDNLKLMDIYQKISNLDRERWKSAVHIECFDPWSEKIIKQEIEFAQVIISSEDLEILLSPTQLLFTQEEELSLCKIALKPKEQWEGLLVEHSQLFFWIQNDWANIMVLDRSFFEQKLNQLSADGLGVEKRKRDLETYLDNIENKKREIKDKYHIPEQLYSILYFFARMTDWRDERKKRAMQLNNFYNIIASEISERTNITLDEATFLMPDEVLNIFSASVDFKRDLKSRAKQCFYYVDIQNHPIVLIDNDYLEFKNVLDGVFGAQFTELKGMVAQKGKISGIVKIVNVPADFAKMKQGDILVAPMTRPEYLPLMKIAGAIVTDEGGVTCHAAIVSRELGKPCIIGTQVATEVLKDGDLVEVDANHGVVTIIKNA